MLVTPTMQRIRLYSLSINCLNLYLRLKLPQLRIQALYVLFEIYSYLTCTEARYHAWCSSAPIIKHKKAIDRRSKYIAIICSSHQAPTMRFGTGDRINSDTAPAILAACFSIINHIIIGFFKRYSPVIVIICSYICSARDF